MSLPLTGQGCGIGGSHVLSLTDLTLASSIASGVSNDSVAFSTGVGATVLVLAKMASGQATVKLKTGASSAVSMASGTTDTVVATGAVGSYNTINTSTASPFVRLRLTDGGSSCAFTDLTVFVIYELTAGEGGDIRNPHNIVASVVSGDGTGICLTAFSPA